MGWEWILEKRQAVNITWTSMFNLNIKKTSISNTDKMTNIDRCPVKLENKNIFWRHQFNQLLISTQQDSETFFLSLGHDS